MKITNTKFIKYFLFILLVLWGLMTFHIVYMYVSYVSPKIPVKGGTLVQGTFEGISFLPYVSQKNNDKLYQSFLFNGCLSPYVTGSKINFVSDLCDVKTSDYKIFTVSVKSGKTWSDGKDITNEDVFFTYDWVLKQNKRNAVNENYKNIDISQVGDSIKVVFPNPSIDNNIFFTNFILPEHILTGANIEQYITIFGKEPVTSGCAQLQKKTVDDQSIIFDLTKCPDSSIGFYQIKNFNSFNEFKDYIKKSSKKIIDIYLGGETLDGFKTHKIVLNQFLTLFYNTTSANMNADVRKSISKIIFANIYTGDYEDNLVKDRFLFDAGFDAPDLKGLLEKIQGNLNNTNKPVQTSQSSGSDIINLPNTIYAGTGPSEYFLPKVDDKFGINVVFGDKFREVYAQANGGGDYKLQTFKAGSNSANYNLSEKFGNIKPGKNTIVIKGKSGSEMKQIINITVYYINKPEIKKTEQPEVQQIAVEEPKKLKIRVIYLDDAKSNYLVDKMQNIFKDNGVSDYFEFTKYNDNTSLQSKLESKDYDILIRGIDMGLKRDMSNLFMTDDPKLNPTMYKSSELALLINQYFTSKTPVTIKREIDGIYSKEVPMIIIGKDLGDMKIRDDIELNYPFRLYDLWLTKDFLKDTVLLYKPEIKKENIFNKDNFIRFLTDGANKKITNL